MFSRSQCWLLVPIIFTSGLAAGQDSLQPAEKEDQKKRWMAVYSEEAAKYQMFRRTDVIEELKLVPTPILAFTNPVRERDQQIEPGDQTVCGKCPTSRTSIREARCPPH